jgi:hypothetical protein
MLKKYVEINWTQESKSSFENIKQDLIEAPILISLDHSKEFLVSYFSSEDTIVIVLL